MSLKKMLATARERLRRRLSRYGAVPVRKWRDVEKDGRNCVMAVFKRDGLIVERVTEGSRGTELFRVTGAPKEHHRINANF